MQLPFGKFHENIPPVPFSANAAHLLVALLVAPYSFSFSFSFCLLRKRKFLFPRAGCHFPDFAAKFVGSRKQWLRYGSEAY